jgi:hypothetical protein
MKIETIIIPIIVLQLTNNGFSSPTIDSTGAASARRNDSRNQGLYLYGFRPISLQKQEGFYYATHRANRMVRKGKTRRRIHRRYTILVGGSPTVSSISDDLL